MNRRRHHPPWPFFIAVMQVVGGLLARKNGHDIEGITFGLLILGPILLTMLRRKPDLVIAGVSATAATFLLLGHPPGPVMPSVIASVIGAALLGRRITAWICLAVLWAIWGYAGSAAIKDSLLDLAKGLGVVVGIAVVAEFIETRRQRIKAYRGLLAEERKRREEEQRRVAGEQKLRMARELHDILAHSLSLINVRASVALELIDSNPEEIRPALQAIKQASRDGLAEVRTVLHGMREEAQRSPAPDLSRLSDLVKDSQAAGLTVQLRTDGDLSTVGAAAALAAYRIVQEALTNVVRHSQAREAAVTVRRSISELSVVVTDPGPSTADGEPGSGLIGIRERAAALGGTATAGATTDGSFTVKATLPLKEST